MSLKDSYFSGDVQEDLELFLKNEQRKRVLVFPPVNNYRRFLIHQLVQDRFAELQTFSIGLGLARRTVVCYKTDYIGPPQINGELQQKSDFGKFPGRMGIESQGTPTASPEHSLQKLRQVKPVPTYEIYRPPALRRAQTERSLCKMDNGTELPAEQPTSNTPTRPGRQKRPDRAVYVPRHRRGAPDNQSSSVSDKNVRLRNEKKSPVRADLSSAAIKKSSRHHITAEEAPPDTDAVTLVKNEVTMELVDLSSEHTNPPKVFQDSLPATSNTSSDPAIISESNNFDPLQEDSKNLPSNTVEEEQIQNIIEKRSPSKEPCASNDLSMESFQKQLSAQETSTSALVMDEKMVESSVDMEATFGEVHAPSIGEKLDVTKCEKSSESDISVDEPLEKKKKDAECTFINPEESDQRDRRKTAENRIVTATIDLTVERSSIDNKTEIDLTANSDEDSKELDCKPENEVGQKILVPKVLVISTIEDEEDVRIINPSPPPPPEKKVKKIETPENKLASPPSSSVTVSRDEDDWESLFDDNGDCLDPTLMEELTSAVGEVVIEKPKSTYKSCKPLKISNDEFAHILEIYDFPSEFKACDLVAAFSSFKSGGFELKWVDDTHCLGVFGSAGIAAEVLASQHPLVKTRPLSEASAMSKLKARKSVDKLQPYKARPETCAALARRLVTKSLGVTLSTARQEREQEKMLLREAKEKKKLANKQREEIWDGVITDNPLP